jgi:diguanylate cyclase (GGDEF)-like protein
MAGLRRAGTTNRPGRIWVLIVLVGLAAASITFAVADLAPIEAPISLPWPLLVPLVFLGEAAIVSLRFRRDAHAFSMSEVPLVVGLFFVSPVALIAAQLIGNALALGVKRRQSAKKLAFNLSLLTLQSALAVIVFRGVLGARDPLGAAGSAATLLAVGVGVVAANLLINRAIVLSGGGLSRKEQIQALALGAASAAMNASLGLVAVTVIWNQPGTLWAAAVPPVALYLAYRAYIAQKEEGQRIQSLYEATQALLRSPQLEEAMVAAVTHARLMFDAEQAEIRVRLADVADEVFCTSMGTDGEAVVMERIAIPTEGEAWSQPGRASLLSCENPGHRTRGKAHIHRMVAPVDGPEGVSGLIVVSEPLAEGQRFTGGDLRFLQTLAGQISVCLENGRLEDSLAEVTKLKDDLRHQAVHDVLTGLGNRALLWEALSRLGDVSRTEGKSAMLLIDLDDFKSINDTLGHQAGDQLLVEVARRLRASCRPEDTVVRLGGDEFAILLEGMSSSGDARIVASRIVQALGRAMTLGNRLVTPQASIGIALVDGILDPEELMRRADQAMYTAKTRQKGTVAEYEESAGSLISTDALLRSELVRAVDQEQMVLHYQPIVDLDSGAITGMEALVRWNHPQRGLLYPDSFIHQAEASGVIVPLGRWILSEACRQAADWHRDLPDPRPTISVNLSPRELAEPDIVAAIALSLETAGLDGKYLIIEITENVMMQPFNQVLEQIKALGVRIALDDFGVGYSSLGYLDRLPIDIVKIDRVFVTGPERSPLVNLILQIGEVLGLHTIAEGIETPDQLAWLRQLGCRQGQGYLFARPQDPPGAGHLLRMGTSSYPVGVQAWG